MLTFIWRFYVNFQSYASVLCLSWGLRFELASSQITNWSFIQTTHIISSAKFRNIFTDASRILLSFLTRPYPSSTFSMHLQTFIASTIIHCVNNHSLRQQSFIASTIINCVNNCPLRQQSFIASTIIHCVNNHSLRQQSFIATTIIHCVNNH